ncbi:tyrosine-type recombinase/integrase [Actinomadura decatromicini]|uniref:tyrosine-type recombinase/integrase n=1 Tax=Actinomadura decatromicini TaxID=2604572 RepID=UPI001CA30A67
MTSLGPERDLFSPRGRDAPIEPRNVNRSFAHRCQRAGFRTIRVHDTRHTCGRLLAVLDVHPRTAMQILRHSQISITMEVHTEVSTRSGRPWSV